MFQEIYDDVFHQLRTKLPAYLTYHTPAHTAYVLDRAEFISKKENVGHHDLLLIKLAALFHDIGFIEDNHGHEAISCGICKTKLKEYAFPAEDINKICGMIMATSIPQLPKTLNEMIVADADLEYLGTDLFYPVSQHLFQEFRHFTPNLTLQRFNEIQIRFITAHHYHTDYCKQNREAKKMKNLQEIIDSQKA